MKVIKYMVCEREWFVHTKEWDNNAVEDTGNRRTGRIFYAFKRS
jgi:hypothetical protein